MKISIEKLPAGTVAVWFFPDDKAKPVKLVLQPAHVALVAQMLEVAVRSAVFKFELEL
jgi:hypothetical protein